MDSLGNPSLFATTPSVNELALDQTSTFLFSANVFSGTVHMFDTLANPLGLITGINTVRGITFDPAGNFYVAETGNQQILQYPASTLPPNTPVGAVYATGINSQEGMEFDCEGNLFVAGVFDSNVLQVVPPAGPHITWANGLGNPLDVAFDPCTNDLFVSDGSAGEIYRVTSPGVFSTFATGLVMPHGLAFDRVGNLYVTLFGEPGIGGSVIKFSTPSPCAGGCLCVVSPDQGIQNLDDDVGDLVETGVLSAGQGASAKVKLDAALQSLYRGNVNAAIGQLQAFINQVSSLIDEGTLTSEEGQALIDAANFIISQLAANG